MTMQSAGLRAQLSYRRRPGKYGIIPAVVAANHLQQDFNVDAPNKVWGEPSRHRFESG
jgi:transposase InsO family protein